MAHGGDAGDRRRFGRIGAVVGDHFDILGANVTVFFEAHFDIDLHEDPRPAAGEKFFFAGIDRCTGCRALLASTAATRALLSSQDLPPKPPPTALWIIRTSVSRTPNAVAMR